MGILDYLTVFVGTLFAHFDLIGMLFVLGYASCLIFRSKNHKSRREYFVFFAVFVGLYGYHFSQEITEYEIFRQKVAGLQQELGPRLVFEMTPDEVRWAFFKTR